MEKKSLRSSIIPLSQRTNTENIVKNLNHDRAFVNNNEVSDKIIDTLVLSSKEQLIAAFFGDPLSNLSSIRNFIPDYAKGDMRLIEVIQKELATYKDKQEHMTAWEKKRLDLLISQADELASWENEELRQAA